MSSKRRGKGKFGHVVQIKVCRLPQLIVTLNLSNVIFAVTCPNSVRVLCLVVYKV